MFGPLAAAYRVPFMMAEMTTASWETVWHRTALILSGQCTLVEYERMITEKLRAVQLAGTAAMTGESMEAMIHPFHKRAVANAKRLRR